MTDPGVASWSPSTDIKHAWAVVENIRSACDVYVSREEGNWVTQIVRRRCDLERGDKELAFEVAETAPLAICLAALAAVGAEVGV